MSGKLSKLPDLAIDHALSLLKDKQTTNAGEGKKANRAPPAKQSKKEPVSNDEESDFEVDAASMELLESCTWDDVETVKTLLDVGAKEAEAVLTSLIGPKPAPSKKRVANTISAALKRAKSFVEVEAGLCATCIL